MFFNFKQNSQKAFFDKIRTAHQKWIKKIFQIFRYGYQKIRLVKSNSNMRSRSIKVEILWEITKSAILPRFSARFSAILLFCKTVPTSTYLEKKKKTLLLAFFITKGHLRWSILVSVKNAFCKCYLELKNTLAFKTWNWFPIQG